jgi:hypothetical protein|tara:strand:- start:692 stop:874 length:183 start_codon:yes stop_codon:yes gene_type:complete
MMPKVGNKEFSYDAAGKKAAAMEAKKTGQAMQTAYKKGGKVKIRGTGAATKGLYARGPMG